MANVSRDEQRHIGFGVKVLSELLDLSQPYGEECRAAVVELLKEVLAYTPAVFRPPNLDRAYTECYGFTMEDIYAFGLKLVRQRWRTIGFPTEEMPPGVFPFDPAKPEEELAAEQVRMMLGGILGPVDGSVEPSKDPELMGLYFEMTARVADPGAATGAPLVYQWKFSDAEPWHLTIDNGSTRAEPGLAPDPAVTIESTWADWLASTKPDADPLKFMLRRKIRPHGRLREIARMRKVFG
jgi:hypothetical protein